METAPPELQNPVLNDADAKEAESLLKLSQEVDREQGTELSDDAQPEIPRVPETEPKPEAKGEQTKPDNSETKPEKQPTAEKIEPDRKDRKRDAQGRFLKDDGSIDPDQTEKPADAKSPSQFEKAKKEADRRERSWQKLEEEKAAVRAQQQQLAQQQAEILRQLNAPRTSPDGRNQYSAAEYQNAAREFYQKARDLRIQGDHEAADKEERNAENAQRAAHQAYEFETKQAQENERKVFTQKYDAVVAKEFETDPELQNPDAPIHKFLKPLLDNEPIFGLVENGFALAKQVAKLQVEAGLASELKDENTKLKAEVERLTKATSLTSSGPTTQTSKKKFEDMELDEQGDELLRRSQNEPVFA